MIPSAHASAPVQPQAEQPPTHWSDSAKEWAKLIVGPFVGSSLGFGLALFLQRRTRIAAEKAAGNLAIAMLAKQRDDFRNIKRGIDKHAEDRKKTPLWLRLPPMEYHFSDGLKFDLPPLAFLFRHGQGNIVLKLMMAETRYYDLARLMSTHAEAAHEAQNRLEAKGLLLDAIVPVATLETIVGPALVARLISLTTALFERMDGDEKDYIDAENTLHALLLKALGRKDIVKAIHNPLPALSK